MGLLDIFWRSKPVYELLQKAAEQGEPQAQLHLGAMYFTGQGVRQDYALAVQWLQKAATQGIPEAQFNLGSMYYNGQGVTQNYDLAVQWWQNAAKQGHREAQKILKNERLNW